MRGCDGRWCLAPSTEHPHGANPIISRGASQDQGFTQGKGLRGGVESTELPEPSPSPPQAPGAAAPHRASLPAPRCIPTQHPWYPGRMRAAAPGGEEGEEEEQLLGSAAAGEHPCSKFAIPQPCPARWMCPGQHKPPPASRSSQPAALKQAQSSPQGGRGGNAETAASSAGLQALPLQTPASSPQQLGVPTRGTPKALVTPHTAPGASRAQAEALCSWVLLEMPHGIVPSPTSKTGLGGG